MVYPSNCQLQIGRDFVGRMVRVIAEDATPTPATWSDKENLKWKIALPGAGVSCPIVVGDKVFVTCYSGYGVSREELGSAKDLKRHLVCIDRATGKTLWEKVVPSTVEEDPYEGMGVPQHGYASHTPTSDGRKRLCVLWQERRVGV